MPLSYDLDGGGEDAVLGLLQRGPGVLLHVRPGAADEPLERRLGGGGGGGCDKFIIIMLNIMIIIDCR